MRRLSQSLPLPPLWVRWAFALILCAILLVALNGAARRAGGLGGTSESAATAAKEAEHDGQVVLAEDQTPHEAPLPASASAQAAVVALITADAHARVSAGQLTGPLQSVTCSVPKAARRGLRSVGCNVRSAGFDYPFVGLIDTASRRLTWCKVDLSQGGSTTPEVPLSPRCQA